MARPELSAYSAEHQGRGDDDGVAVDYTVVAYMLDEPGPYAAHAILNQRQVLKPRAADGALQIVEQLVHGFDLGQG